MSMRYERCGSRLVTELVFNFGPRELMRTLRFEDNRLISIETAGNGYLKKAD